MNKVNKVNKMMKMNNRLEKKPILMAVILILIYIAGVGVGDALSESIRINHLVTLPILLVLSVVLFTMAQKRGYFNNVKVTKENARKCFYYVPLFVLAIIQFFGGINQALTMRDILIFVWMMIGVGFVEEVLFRGFLFKGILAKSGLKRAILISGITFGLGHIVNLLNGYGSIEQVHQIVVAVAIGLVLALLVAITDSLLPGILFHIVFNISGSITNQESNIQSVMVIAILAIALPYAWYLSRLVNAKRAVLSAEC